MKAGKMKVGKWICIFCNSRYLDKKEAKKCCVDNKWTRTNETDQTVKDYLQRARKIFEEGKPPRKVERIDNTIIVEIAKMIQLEEK